MIRGLAICLILTSAAYAQAPTVQGPAGSYTTTQTLPSSGPVSFPSPWTGPPGTYQITIPSSPTIVQTSNSLMITWGNNPNPPAPPSPQPNPPPNPSPLLPVTPQSTALTVVAVFDRTALPPQAVQAQLQTSQTIGPALKALNCTWACVDVTTPTAQAWIAEARAAGIPALLVITTDGQNRAGAFEAVPLPQSGEPGVLAELNRIRGISTITPSPQVAQVNRVKMRAIERLLTDVKHTLERR